MHTWFSQCIAHSHLTISNGRTQSISGSNQLLWAIYIRFICVTVCKCSSTFRTSQPTCLQSTVSWWQTKYTCWKAIILRSLAIMQYKKEKKCVHWENTESTLWKKKPTKRGNTLWVLHGDSVGIYVTIKTTKQYYGSFPWADHICFCVVFFFLHRIAIKCYYLYLMQRCGYSFKWRRNQLTRAKHLIYDDFYLIC